MSILLVLERVIDYLPREDIFFLRLVCKRCTFPRYNYIEHICFDLSYWYNYNKHFLAQQASAYPYCFHIKWRGNDMHILYLINHLPFVCENIKKLSYVNDVKNSGTLPDILTKNIREVAFYRLPTQKMFSISMPNLRVLSISDDHIMLKLNLPELTKLSIRSNKKGKVCLNNNMTNLECLELIGVVMSDLAILPCFTKIRRLALSYQPAQIESFPNGLEELEFHNQNHREQHLINFLTFVNLTRLEKLCIFQSRYSYTYYLPGPWHLSKLTGLKHLEIPMTSYEEMRSLGKLNLEYLAIKKSRSESTNIWIEPVSLQNNIGFLEGCHTLRSLKLNLPVKDGSIFRQLKGLTRLHIHDINTNDLNFLEMFTNLQRLCLRLASPLDLKVLSTLINLTRLHLVIDEEVLLKPLAYLTKLSRVKLTYEPQFQAINPSFNPLCLDLSSLSGVRTLTLKNITSQRYSD